jgi:hypothetical protein
MTLRQQVERLIGAGVPRVAGLAEAEFAALAADLPQVAGAVVAVHPDLVGPARLAALLSRSGRPGFVVEDMTDVADFAAIEAVDVPGRPLYLVRDPARGDDLRNVSPDDALPAILAAGRTPLTLNEGISWVLQDPEVLVPGACFMTIGSRRVRGARLDPRTPALWISSGTGRDGPQRRGAPKVGWCWASNRHTWLGHASAAGRATLAPASALP